MEGLPVIRPELDWNYGQGFSGGIIARPIMPLVSGTKLGQYEDEVVGLLGAGGMGEVYRALTRS